MRNKIVLLGGLELGRYEEDSKTYIQWLSRFTSSNWEKNFPQLAAYPYHLFDYETEDPLLPH
ncbi:hypothetical protein ACPDHL_13370 [Myroides sp. C15-4]|uniref:hypothetical protein n=1 Tax=Myroides sp. C15-4 TaxID=3400532 RepID=UPI003D2F8901